jgi:hypothetical protein
MQAMKADKRIERMKIIALIYRLDRRPPPPLPRRRDTQAINWAALREVTCPDCGKTWELHSSTDRAYKTCNECRDKMRAPDATHAGWRAFRELLLGLLTDEWQSVADICELLGYGRPLCGPRQKVRDTLRRMSDTGAIEGCYKRIVRRGPASRCYRRLQC